MLPHCDSLQPPHPTPILNCDLFDKLVEQGMVNIALDYKQCLTPARHYSPAFTLMRLRPLIANYLRLVNVPKRVNFLTRDITVTNEQEKNDIEHKFWLTTDNFHTVKFTCTNCGAYIAQPGVACTECFVDGKLFGASYADMTRTNFNSKYSYFRRQHFYECIVQFQGRHPAKIEPEILEKLARLYRTNNQACLTKLTIMKWLKDMNATRHYENIHLLYSILSKIPCPNLDTLESTLLSDFDIFLCQYTKIFSHDAAGESRKLRKNFISVQYVLYQFLTRHHFPCKQDDFILPRTIEIRKLYDSICGKIFATLQWNHTKLV